LTFLGTRGEIDIRSRRHRRHSSLLVTQGNARVMIDCGGDWLGRIDAVTPTAIVLTHAHPDHAAGLAEGAPCPVYATSVTWSALRRWPVRDRRQMPVRKAVSIEGMTFKALPVEHSTRAPAVAFRISVDGSCFFYVPDVARLPSPSNALRGVDLYIGDGASITRSLLRRANGALIGHASIQVQLGWCEEVGVSRAIFTHCGTQIVRGRSRAVNAAVRQLGCGHGIDARIACDGDRLSLPPVIDQTPCGYETCQS
jgi:phosphoribosyl 1,2-cyclic phosphodiesterase